MRSGEANGVVCRASHRIMRDEIDLHVDGCVNWAPVAVQGTAGLEEGR